MDRVSDLPDEILCHILSFLTTKEAALTSILAKRWRNLLAFLPCLTIDDSLLLHPQYGSQETKRSFTDFVDTVLFACSQSMPVFENLKSFAIKSDKGCGWQAMPALLRNCPRLETLVIEGLMQDVTSMCGGVCNCISGEAKGLSLGFCRVRLLKIHRFQGRVKEMEIIKHFLDSLPCLEEMRVYVEEKNSLTTELEENREVSKRVLEMFQLYKKSSSCNVKLMVGDVLCI
ncbi:hypothetical protein Bca52824_009030 [Brassica carinata]|uniref:F-box domain-containing protein n=1 Tax=Brassica carinata TaxID=52824 RepID=A0A8X8B9E1_BRACI|nr:hypothetical protein Bca52824_009030 [Brassica carinata]